MTKENLRGREFLVFPHCGVEITEFYCQVFVAKIPSNQLSFLLKELEIYSKLIWRGKKICVANFPYFIVRLKLFFFIMHWKSISRNIQHLVFNNHTENSEILLYTLFPHKFREINITLYRFVKQFKRSSKVFVFSHCNTITIHKLLTFDFLASIISDNSLVYWK